MPLLTVTIGMAPGIALKLCGLDGEVEHRVVPKRDKAAYALARRLDWGDTL